MVETLALVVRQIADYAIIGGMKKNLSQQEIRSIVKTEKSRDAYRDELDLTIDQLARSLENKKIDEESFRIITSIVINATSKKMIGDLATELIKKKALGIKPSEPNKLLLLNYSRNTYA